MDKKVFLTCKDHLVTGEEFDLVKLEDSEILKTDPVPENLAKYYDSKEYISHTDSSENLQDKLYHWIKNFMLLQKLKWINEFKEEGSILDIGAGTGDFLEIAKLKNWKVKGVEPNTSAREKASQKGIVLKEKLSEISSSYFDVITMWHVLEHVKDPDSQIQYLKDLLNENGILVIAVPNFKSYDAIHYKKNWAAYDVPRHLWHFSKKGIEQLFKKNGFSLIKTKPLVFDSFYVSLLSEKHKSGSSNFIKAFFTGLYSNLSATRTGEYSSLVYFFEKS